MSSLSTLRTTLLGLVSSGWVITLLLAAITGLHVDYEGLVESLGAGMVSCAMLIAYTAYRGYAKLRALCETVAAGVALTVPVLLSTYLAMRVGQPLADAQLRAMDDMLFDWQAFVALVDSQPILAWFLEQSYQSFAIQLLALPVALSLLGKAERAYRMVIAFGLIGFVSSAIAIWYPALGTYPSYFADGAAFENIDTHFGYFFLQQFNAVRSDPNFIFTPKDFAGIITFPSVHAAVAILCAWAAWELTLMRLPLLALNALMATSAISHANHYLIDVIGGIAVAAVCIVVAARLARERTTTRAGRAHSGSDAASSASLTS